MDPDQLALGGFTFQRQGEQIILHTPARQAAASLQGFLRGARHLLRMEFDLEGSAELDGGLVFRIQGDRVRLRLGDYAEVFPAEAVETLFRQLAESWSEEAGAAGARPEAD